MELCVECAKPTMLHLTTKPCQVYDTPQAIVIAVLRASHIDVPYVDGKIAIRQGGLIAADIVNALRYMGFEIVPLDSLPE